MANPTPLINLGPGGVTRQASHLPPFYFPLGVPDPSEPPVAALSADTTSGAAPLAVQFTDESTGSPTAWLWDFGDGDTSTSQNPSHTYTDAGTYTVGLTVTNADGSDTVYEYGYVVAAGSGNLVTNLTAFHPLGGYPGHPRPPAVGAAWGADIRGTVGTAVGSIGPCAVFDGTNALGLPYGDDSTLNISGDVDLTVRFRLQFPVAPANAAYMTLFSARGLDGTNWFDWYLTTGSGGTRTYVQLDGRTAANAQFNVTWYNYTGSGPITLSADTWYTVVLRYNATTDVWKADLLEIPEYGASASNSTSAAGLRGYVSNSLNTNLTCGGRYDTPNGWAQAFTGRIEGLYIWRGYRATDEEVATMGEGFDPTGYYTTKRLVVSKPQVAQVHQKDGDGLGTMVFSAALGGGTQSATDYQLSWNGQDWADASATVDNTKQIATFTATLTPAAATPAARQGTLLVRLKNAPAVGVSLADIGVGWVFGTGGQSNCCGAYTNPQAYSGPDGLEASYYHPSYQIRYMTDPTHRADDNWIDSSTESEAAGSVWPLFAALWSAETGWPTMTVSLGRSGAVIGANDTGNGYAGWAPDAGNYRFQMFSLYDSAVRRVQQLPGGIAALLFMEGESNAPLGTSAATYKTGVVTFAEAFELATGAKTLHSTLPTGLSGATAINTGVADAVTESASAVAGADNSGRPYDSGPHWTTDASAAVIAGNWVTACTAALT